MAHQLKNRESISEEDVCALLSIQMEIRFTRKFYFDEDYCYGAPFSILLWLYNDRGNIKDSNLDMVVAMADGPLGMTMFIINKMVEDGLLRKHRAADDGIRFALTASAERQLSAFLSFEAEALRLHHTAR